MKLIRTFLVAVALVFAAPVWANAVNINTADAETLKNELAGVGPTRAKAIVEYRKKHGPFKKVEDLLKVEGIGKRTFAVNRKIITVEGK